jgi:hypothetical protein
MISMLRKSFAQGIAQRSPFSNGECGVHDWGMLKARPCTANRPTGIKTGQRQLPKILSLKVVTFKGAVHSRAG